MYDFPSSSLVNDDMLYNQEIDIEDNNDMFYNQESDIEDNDDFNLPPLRCSQSQSP